MSNPTVTAEHKNRIKQELIDAGVTKYGLLKMDARHLPEIIHPKEHIKAVAYGLRNGFSGILVATDRRIIYTERKPFYKVLDEVGYPTVLGISYALRGPRAAIVLHTSIGDYSLSLVNKKPAEKFVQLIESASLESTNTK